MRFAAFAALAVLTVVVGSAGSALLAAERPTAGSGTMAPPACPELRSGDGLEFCVYLVSSMVSGMEPTLSYDKAHTLYYSAMRLAPTDANLWRFDGNENKFVLQAPPPTSGGYDPVVHFDGGTDELLFFVEQCAGTCVPTTDLVAVKAGQEWRPVRQLNPSDRPWLATIDGVTHLLSNSSIWSEPCFSGDYVYHPDEDTPDNLADETVWTPTPIQGWRAFDIAVDADGNLVALFGQDCGIKTIGVGVRLKGAPGWSAVQPVAQDLNSAYGLPRLVVNDAKEFYVVYGGQDDGLPGPDYSPLWLRRITLVPNPEGVSWVVGDAEPLTLPGTTASLPALVAGKPGSLGFVAYEAPGEFFPGLPPGEPPTWKVTYTLVDLTTSPWGRKSVVLDDAAHVGALVPPTGTGEFNYGRRIPGDGQGHVALAWADDVDCGEVCPLPRFARQDGGSGLEGEATKPSGLLDRLPMKLPPWPPLTKKSGAVTTARPTEA